MQLAGLYLNKIELKAVERQFFLYFNKIF
ncbi:hypothetical protein KIS1582_3286, partial [Cytobacillus firmus]